MSCTETDSNKGEVGEAEETRNKKRKKSSNRTDLAAHNFEIFINSPKSKRPMEVS